MRPRAIGIDILIDQAQPEDEELIEPPSGPCARRPISPSPPMPPIPDQIADWQEECMRGLFRSVSAGAGCGPTSIRMEPGHRGRRHPPLAAARPGLAAPLLANAMTREHPEFVGYTGAIDFRLPGRSRRTDAFPKCSIEACAISSWSPRGRRRVLGASRAVPRPLRPDRRRYQRCRRFRDADDPLHLGAG